MSSRQWAWHIHDGLVCGELTESLEARRAYILANKPPEEVALRLRLLKLVQDAAAMEAYEAARVQACAAYEAAERAAREAFRASMRAAWAALIEPLHRRECPGCPWDGTSIFPERA